jgi:hypothetical protein
MKILKLLVLMLSIGILTSCSTNKKINKETMEDKATESIKMEMNKMVEAGFTEGTIVASRAEGDCPFTIEVPGESAYFLDPINLGEEFKVNGQKIWFKYAGLRMMNRCEKANPVNLIEIQKREE